MTGQGVHGAVGVLGKSDSGVGVHASSGSGMALQVTGKASFSRSGLATVRAGTKSVTVKLPGVLGTSLVLATLQQASGAIGVAAAVPASGSFTIHLTAAPKKNAKVAYLVLD